MNVWMDDCRNRWIDELQIKYETKFLNIIILILQLNYEFLRKCVASAPVTPMQPQTWDHIMSRIPRPLLINPITKPLIPALNKEVATNYEETIRKTNSK